MKSKRVAKAASWSEKRQRHDQKLAQRYLHNSELSGTEAVDAAREAALSMLDRRSYSRGEISRKLLDRGFCETAVCQVLDRFEEVGLLDDLAYAQMLVRTRHQERHLVGQALYLELSKKHIPADIAAQAMEQISGVDFAELALKLACNRAASTTHLPRETRYRRLMGYLSRKGFTPPQISVAIRTALSEYPGDESPGASVDNNCFGAQIG